MKAFTTLLSMLFIISFVNGTYSIDVFLEYLQNEGYYDLLLEIKNSLGDDVAIYMCKELVKSDDCDIVVKVYMTSSDRKRINPTTLEPIDIDDEEEKTLLENLINRIKLSLMFFKEKYEKFLTLMDILLRYYDVLMKTYDNVLERLEFIRKAKNKVLR